PESDRSCLEPVAPGRHHVCAPEERVGLVNVLLIRCPQQVMAESTEPMQPGADFGEDDDLQGVARERNRTHSTRLRRGGMVGLADWRGLPGVIALGERPGILAA